MVGTEQGQQPRQIMVVAVAVVHRLLVQMEQRLLAGMAGPVRHQASAVGLLLTQAVVVEQPKAAGQAAREAQVAVVTAPRQTQLAAQELLTPEAEEAAAVKLAEALQQQAVLAAPAS